MFVEHAKLVRGRMAEAVNKLTVLWWERAKDSRVMRHLGEAERKFLLASIRCYRTVVTETLRVVKGTPPWHLAAAAAFKFRDESKRAIERERARDDNRSFLGWGLWEGAVNMLEGEGQVVWVHASVQDG